MALENPTLWASQPGTSADTNDLTEEGISETSGRATWDGFFGQINSISTKSGGIAPMREDFNGLFALITEQLWFLQRGGVYRYDADVTYEQDAIAFLNGVLWISLVDNNLGNNPEEDDGTNWVQLVTKTELNERLSTVETRLGLITDESLESLSSLDDLAARVDAIEEAVTDSDVYKSAVEALAAVDGVTNLSAYISNHTRGPLDLGSAGDYGFGLGYVEGETATELEEYLNLTGMERNTDPRSDTYGNYVHQRNGSFLCLFPAGYVRYGSEGAEQYDVWGGNSVEIISPEEYDKLSTADAEGFVWPRVGWDGGEMKDFFVYGKYQGHIDDDSQEMVCTPFLDPTPDTGTETGYAYSLIDHARAVGDGWNMPSVFMHAWMNLLMWAHMQKLTSAEKCAWYDPNLVNCSPWPYNRLGNRDDENSLLTRLQITREMYRMNSHNGQMCGAMDFGHYWDRGIGMTAASTSSTTTTGDADADIYLMSTSTALKDITSGFDGDTDNWRTADNFSEGSTFDKYTNDLPFATSDYTSLRWGNGDEPILTDPTDSDGYGYPLFGIVAPSTDAMSTDGTNMTGCAYYNRYWRMNVFPLFFGSGSTSSSTAWTTQSGVFSRYFASSRTSTRTSYAARLAAYPA